MLRVTWITAWLGLLLSAAQAQQPLNPVAPAADPEMRGIVTIVATYGQFYTNIGAKERLCPGARLLLVRDGVVAGQARVLKVGLLDSIAELLPECRAVVPHPGDVVLVLSNPTQPEGRRLRSGSLLARIDRGCEPPELPAIEPDMDFRELDLFYNLAILAGMVLIIVD